MTTCLPPLTAAMTPSLADRADRCLVGCFGTGRRAIVAGRGCTLGDDAGGVYLDLLSGIGVACLGHAHPAISAALAEQAQALVHCSNLFVIEPQVRLGEWLTERTFADRALFVNSGSEAIEAAIKIARRRATLRGEAFRREILSFEGSFHGRTYAAMSATGQPKVRKGFDPIVPGFEHLPFADAAAFDRAIGPETAAVLLEPVQGEGGLRPFPDDFLRRVRAKCDEVGAILIADEIQCGMGRTGSLLAISSSGVEPDVACLAKALGGGVPIGAVIATEECAAALAPGTHGTTYGGNPLVCAAALAVCETIERDDLVARAARIGARLRTMLEALVAKHANALEVRGRGLMLGLRVAGEAKPIAAAILERGVIVGTAGPDVLRLLPPYVVSEAELEQGVAAIDSALAEAAAD